MFQAGVLTMCPKPTSVNHDVYRVGSDTFQYRPWTIARERLWPIERYNVAPTTRVGVIRPVEDGISIDKVRWEWSPSWAKGKRPDLINARVETVMTGKFFKELWPANGWFEWVKDPTDPKKKQPYVIRLRDERPMFFAALGQVRPGLELDERDGFVIITADSDQGMVDIHDRRPVVLSAEHAREWVDPNTPALRAEELARECCLDVSEFVLYRLARRWATCGIRGRN